MGDFLLVAHPPGPIHAARSRGFRTAAERDGMTVVDIGERIWVGQRGPGPLHLVRAGPWWLIGEVHNRRRRIVDRRADDLPCTFERKLVSRFWGRFVGALVGGDGDLRAVLRDPCGGLDCVVWDDAGLVFAASAVPAWLDLPPVWRIDWGRVLEALHDPLLVWDQLLLSGPTAVRPGTVQAVPLGGDPCEIWTPAAVARRGSAPPLTDDEAAAALRQAIDDTVEALARGAGRLGAEVSGGLDSSIVASSLARVRDDVRPWINLFGPEAQSDERTYVAALAARLGFEPLYVPHATGPLDAAGFAAMATGIRPGLSGLDFHHDADWARRLEAAGATAIMTGRGGDSLLVQGATAEVFADLWRDCGWRAIASPQLTGLARLNHQSVWTLIARARRAPSSPAAACSALFRPTAIPSPPWLQDCGDLGPAKTQQIRGLIDGIGRQGPSLQTRAMTVMTPLLSLPVVETVLALPTAQLVTGARERGLARSAFRERLPEEIVTRRTKGEMSATYGRMIARNLDHLRPFLLEGQLAGAGLLNLQALDAALTYDHLVWRGDYGLLMSAAAIEAWVRHWNDRLSPRRAADRLGSPPAIA